MDDLSNLGFGESREVGPRSGWVRGGMNMEIEETNQILVKMLGIPKRNLGAAGTEREKRSRDKVTRLGHLHRLPSCLPHVIEASE